MSLFDTRYPFFSAYLKGEEAKIVTADHINKMLGASSIQDILAIIGKTSIGSYLEEAPVKTFEDVDERLWKYLSGCLEYLEWFKPVPADITKILKAYIVKYDILNIKAALQGISTGRKSHSIPLGVIHGNGLLDELFSAEDVNGIIGALTRCGLVDYTSILEEYKIDEGVESSLLTEARLDGVYYKNLLDMARGIEDGSILSRVFGIIIDMTNLQVILRAVISGIGVEAAESTVAGGREISDEVARELLALELTKISARLKNTAYRDVVEEIVNNYAGTKSLGIIEEIIDKHKFRLVREMLSLRLLSPLVLVWYLILKEVEIRDLRLILKAMFDNVPVEGIKNYLVLSS